MPGGDPKALLLVLLLVATTAFDSDEADVLSARVDAAIEELASDDSVARELAVERLISIGRPAVPALLRLLSGDPPPLAELACRRAHGAILGVSPEVARSLDGHMEEADDGDDATLSEVARAIVDAGDAAVRYVVRDDDGRDYRPAGLVRRVRALDAVRGLADGDNGGDRAARALARMGDDAVSELSTIAASDAVPEAWRLSAAERLLQLGGADVLDRALSLTEDGPRMRAVVVPFLCAAAHADRFDEVAARVTRHSDEDPALSRALESFADRVSTDVLRASMRRGNLSRVKAFAARMVGVRRDAAARPELIELIGSDRPEVVEPAAISLGRIGDDEDLDLLCDLLEHDDPRLRRAAVQSIGDLGAGDGLAWLAATLADEDASVRARAASALAASQDDAAIDPLIAALDDDDPNVMAAATQALRRLTSESLATVAAVSDFGQRRASRDAWRDWWQRRVDADDEDESTAADVPDPAGPLAAEGARILDSLARTLRREFRPYGALKERDATATAKLVEAAASRMGEVIDRTGASGYGASERLTVGDPERRVLRHLVRRGRFGGVGELARMVGSLPLDLGARDYILLVYEAADAMVRSLDDRFTRLSFLSDAGGEVNEEELPAMFGKQESIGVMLDQEEGGARVAFVYALSPADRAGVLVGDRVISINGELTAGMDRRQIARALKEPAELLLLRDGWTQPVVFHMEPAAEDPEDLVTHAVLPGEIGYLRLRSFQPGCAQEVEWALRKMEKQGIRGLVFDLRNNPGGTVLDAIAIVDKFVPAGETITTTWTNSATSGEDHVEQKTESTDSETDRDYPVAVLVNRCSASASEMTSGALQDLERAVVVGRTSFGKGIGQSSGETVKGFTRRSVFGEVATSFSLTITVLEYFLPTGRSIQGIGVEPDVVVTRPILLGERFELVRRVRTDERTLAYVDRLVAENPAAAADLAAFDGWDTVAYPGFEQLREDLDIELSRNLVRHGLRLALRDRLAGSDRTSALVDVQEDEDLRAAIAALAEDLGLDLGAFDEYADLAP